MIHRAPAHIDRRPRLVRQDEDRRVERRVVAPGAPELRFILPAGMPELPGTHYLRPDTGDVPLRERVVRAEAAAVPLPGVRSEHPLVQPFTGMSERGFGSLTVPGPETVQRDGEVVDPNLRHGAVLPTRRW